MNTTTITMLFTALLSTSTAALAAEALPLPTPEPEAITQTQEAVWDTATLDELTEADRLVVVSAAVGDKIVLDPGFKVAHVDVDDLWITDVEIARRGKGVVVQPTQVGVTHLYVADADGWVLEYELKVEAGVEDPALAAYEVDVEDTMPVIADASAALN